MYDLVSGKQLVKGSYLLSKSTALEEFPMLKADKLVGAIVYYDGQHNDARMNLAIALTAVREKANIANHVEAIGLIKEKVNITSVRFDTREFFSMSRVPLSTPGIVRS